MKTLLRLIVFATVLATASIASTTRPGGAAYSNNSGAAKSDRASTGITHPIKLVIDTSPHEIRTATIGDTDVFMLCTATIHDPVSSVQPAGDVRTPGEFVPDLTGNLSVYSALATVSHEDPGRGAPIIS